MRIDLVLADYRLPSFDGLSALKLALSARPDLPFIFVSGFGEEIAIEALTSGATDYVLKTRLSGLAPAVRRALREARERAKRKKAEQALRRSEMYLAEAERLSQTGSFGWNASTSELYWSDGSYRVFEYDPAIRPTLQLVVDRTHPDDRTRQRQILDRAAVDGRDFTYEHRLMAADGSVKHVQVVAHRLSGEDPGHFVFVGAITDITERKRAEEERERLRQLETNLAHISRVSMMGELTASLAHEIKQPITAAVMDANACMRWLRRDQPEVMEACSAASRMVASVTRGRRHHRPGSLALRAGRAGTGSRRPKRNSSGDDGFAGGHGGSALDLDPEGTGPGPPADDRGSGAAPAGPDEPHAQRDRGDAGHGWRTEHRIEEDRA